MSDDLANESKFWKDDCVCCEARGGVVLWWDAFVGLVHRYLDPVIVGVEPFA